MHKTILIGVNRVGGGGSYFHNTGNSNVPLGNSGGTGSLASCQFGGRAGGMYSFISATVSYISLVVKTVRED